MKTYRIRIQSLAGTAYVSRLPRWDGAWFDHDISAAKIYKSRTWAEKWLAERPCIVGAIEEIPSK